MNTDKGKIGLKDSYKFLSKKSVFICVHLWIKNLENA